MSMIQGAMKLFNGLLDRRTQTRKALNRAKEQQAAAQAECEHWSSKIFAATTTEPGTYRTINATQEQLREWRANLATAQAALNTKAAETNRIVAELAAIEAELAQEMTLKTAKIAHDEAVATLDEATKRLAAIRVALQRTGADLAQCQAHIDQLGKDAVLTADSDCRGAVVAMKNQQDEIAVLELLLEQQRHAETLAISDVDTATKNLGAWDKNVWRLIADSEFSADEIASIRKRLLRAYVSYGYGDSILGYVGKLFGVTSSCGVELSKVRKEIALEHGLKTRW